MYPKEMTNQTGVKSVSVQDQLTALRTEIDSLRHDVNGLRQEAVRILNALGLTQRPDAEFEVRTEIPIE